MADVNRQQIFAQAARKLRQDFSELVTVPHRGLKGTEAEAIVRGFLTNHLPKRFDVGSGFILDQRDQLSKQIDLIIYDALNCPVYRASDTAAIIPSDNVAGIVEVKSRLDKGTMAEACENAAVAKALAKTPPPTVPFLVTAQTHCYLFAFDSPLTLNKLAEHYADFVRQHGLGRHIDGILVLDKGIITLSTRIPGHPWGALMMEGTGGKHSEGAHIAVSATPLGEDSLDAFLRLILAQLIHFRAIVSHPGFQWVKDGPPPLTTMIYLTSICHEADPVLREAKLREYAEQVRAEFEKSPLPPDEQPRTRGRPSADTATPDVIYMPPPDK